MLNAAGRDRRYRTLRTLQLTKQITLNQRTPIRCAPSDSDSFIGFLQLVLPPSHPFPVHVQFHGEIVNCGASGIQRSRCLVSCLLMIEGTRNEAKEGNARAEKV